MPACTLELAVPKVRPGSCYPSLLHLRRRAEQALRAVVQEAYVQGAHPGQLVRNLRPSVNRSGKAAMTRPASEMSRVPTSTPVPLA